MFDKMLGLVKDEVAKVVGGMGTIPQEKQGAVVETASSSLMNGLKQYANPSTLYSLLGVGGAKEGANMATVLSSGVMNDLTSKTGLTSSAAQGVAGSIVPAVISLLGKHVADPAQPGFNLQSIVGALKGGGQTDSGGGFANILGSLGSLFGKK